MPDRPDASQAEIALGQPNRASSGLQRVRPAPSDLSSSRCSQNMRDNVLQSSALMKIATFNINNINRRLPNLLAWLDAARPDVVCLQELKAADSQFPEAAIAER